MAQRRSAWAIAKELYARWQEDFLLDAAAAVAFFGMLALFPFLIFLVSLASLLIDPGIAERLIHDLGRVAPAEVTEILGGEIHTLIARGSSGLVTLSAIVAFWAASGGITAVIRALNTAYGVKESRPFWKVRLIAFGTTVGAAFFTLLAAVIVVGLPAIPTNLVISDSLRWLRFPVAGALMMAVWAVLYHLLPDTRVRFRLITPGSVAGVLLWIAASWGFSAYVLHLGRYEVTYGALGSVVILLLWIWISSLALLLGAEINVVLGRSDREDRRRGG